MPDFCSINGSMLEIMPRNRGQQVDLSAPVGNNC